MTKQEELNAIRELAEKLGNNTYCGPWLKRSLPFIEQDMRNDFPIDVAQLVHLREEMLNLSKEMEDVRKEAQEKIQKMYADARKQVEDYKANARERIQLELKRISEKVNFELM